MMVTAGGYQRSFTPLFFVLLALMVECLQRALLTSLQAVGHVAPSHFHPACPSWATESRWQLLNGLAAVCADIRLGA